jgi:outer membrane beta-barrel protein
MTSRALRRAALAAALAAAAALPGAAAANSAADAFGGRIPPVSGQLHTKAGKLEVTPTFLVSLNDAFFSKYFAGAKVGWHLSEALSVSASVAAGAARATGSTTVCPGNEGCHPASRAQLNQVPGELKSLTGLEVAFAPVYGKLNVFAEKVIHFDLSLLAGADLVRYRGVLPAAAANAGESPGVENAFGGHLGLGARVFLSRSLALRLEVKDYLYRVPELAESTLQNQLFAEIGVSFFLGGGRGR